MRALLLVIPLWLLAAPASLEAQAVAAWHSVPAQSAPLARERAAIR